VASVLAVAGLADAGIRTEIIRRVGAAMGADDRDGLLRSVRDGVTLLTGMAAILLVAGALLAPTVRTLIFPGGVAGHSPADIDLLVRATVALLAVSLVGNGYFSVLRGMQRGDVEASSQALSTPVGAALTVAGVLAGWDMWALFAGAAAQLAMQFLVEWIRLRRLLPELRLRIGRLTPNLAKAYLGLSTLALVSQVSDVVDSQWDKVVLSHVVGSSAVTSFQVGVMLVLQAKALALLPLAPLLVTVAELHGRDDARLERLYHLMSRVTYALGFTLLSAVFVFAPAFIALWLGPQYTAAGTAARLFAIAVALNLMGAPLGYRAFGEKWHRLSAVASALNMVVNASVSLSLTLAIGFNGALYGSIAGNLAGLALFVMLMRRRLGHRWRWPSVRSVILGVALGLTTILLRFDQTSSWSVLVTSAVVYTLALGAGCTIAERLPLAPLLHRALLRGAIVFRGRR
jgi:O-antigen/teichoic acid export membrane protein